MSDYTDHQEDPDHEELEPVRDYKSRAFFFGVALAYSVFLNIILIARLES